MSSNVAAVEASSVRYHGLDALRAWAMSLGIVLHAAWIMVPGEAGAPATDASAHSFFDWLCLAIHTFRMQLFFVMAGFFACLLLRKRGVLKFVKNRFSRIVLPLVVFWILLCPIMMWQYNVAGLRSGAIQSESSAIALTVEFFAAMTPDSTMFLHLWFLYYLAWAYVFTVLARAIMVAIDRDGAWRQRASDLFGAIVVRPWSAVVLAAAFAPMIWLMKGPWGIEVGFDTLFLKWPGMITYLLYFIAGWLIFRNVDKLDLIVKGWRWQLAIGLLLTVPYYFGAHAAIQNGYATWKYPLLSVEDVQYDHENDRFDYPALRGKLQNAEEGSIAMAVWQAIPELNREWVTDHETASQNQLTGLMNSINIAVLTDPKFPEQVDISGLTLSDQAVATSQLAENERDPDQSTRLNREILIAGFGGVIRTEDIHQPFYYATRAFYAFAYSLTTWLLIFGCIGLFQTYCNHESKFWRYFSDSSYWMYLAHLPIQFQILLWVGDKPWSGPVKFLVYVVGTAAILVPSYHFLVRPTWIGYLLNGRTFPIKQPRKVSDDLQPQAEPDADQSSPDRSSPSHLSPSHSSPDRSNPDKPEPISTH